MPTLKRAALCLGIYLTVLSLQAAEPDKSNLAIGLAERLHGEGKFAEARTILLASLEEALKQQNSERRIALVDGLGSVAQDQGQYLDAEKYYRRSLVYWQTGGEGSLTGLAQTLNNLASLLDGAHKFGEAEELLRRSEAIQVQRLGRDAPEVGVVLLNRGTLHLREQV